MIFARKYKEPDNEDDTEPVTQNQKDRDKKKHNNRFQIMSMGYESQPCQG